MTLSTQPYKGSRDFYPEDQKIQSWMLGRMAEIVQGYGYLEYNGPMLEPFELYAAKTGEEVVNQQLYSFMDRGERKVAIRPEMTPTLARMVAAKLQDLPKPVRWFSTPNLWRYERPQRGRLREHWQLNVDVLGGDSLLADAEAIEIVIAIFEGFGGRDKLRIKVNNRRLMDHFFYKVLGLNETGAYAMAKLIDAKAKLPPEKFTEGLVAIGVKDQALIESFLTMNLATIAQKFPNEGAAELTKLFSYLEASASNVGSVVDFDASIMRGMDYYTGNVFEAYDISPENNRALCGGGRYDNLIGLFGKQQLSGIGFGLGDVTLRNFLEIHCLLPKNEFDVDVFVTTPGEAQLVQAQKIAADLRRHGLKVALPLGFEGFGSQLKKASKLKARWVLLLGEDELKRGAVSVKDLQNGQQSEIAVANLAAHFKI